ncbi:DUF3137 domain-containing protein [Verrucomicrobia bacterium S94]|nr:DUF3137 domain-containing protein [Verrucomicrobia bacterium S94]
MGGAIIAVICIIGAVIWGICAGKKRRDGMTLLAEELGLDCHHERNYQLADRYRFPDKLRQGSNCYACNILSGNYRDHEIAAFNYHYETYSTDADGKRQTDHHHFSFFILTLPKCFPELTIAKEDLFSKIARTVSDEDIDFENREFAKQFTVRCTDKKFAYNFCNTHMMEFLLSHPDINIELDQNQLAVGYHSQLKVEEIRPRLDHLIEIRNLMPDALFAD